MIARRGGYGKLVQKELEVRRQLVEYEQPVGMGGVQYPGLGDGGGGGGGNEFRRKDPCKLQNMILVIVNILRKRGFLYVCICEYTVSTLIVVQNISQEFRLLECHLVFENDEAEHHHV